MGLDTSHDAWHGAYSAFARWREELARAAGLPPLALMEGFFRADDGPLANPFWKQFGADRESGYTGARTIWDALPIRWDCLKPSPLHILLNHSDCDGKIKWQDCGPIADALQRLLPKLPKEPDGGHIGDWREKTKAFIKGLRKAAAAKENVEFH